MSNIQRGVEIFKNKGLRELASRASQQAKKAGRDAVMGGKSSRPRVQNFAGALRPVFDGVFRLKYGRGADVMDEDWDTLVLLDACRYDDFAKLNTLDGSLEQRLSTGADSKKFIKHHFRGAAHRDTVYVTANPHIGYIGDNVFHEVVADPLDKFDQNMGCVMPDVVSNAAQEAHERYPNKRLIIHYMQPHFPPIGDQGRELLRRLPESKLEGVGSHDPGERLMDAVVAGQISIQEARMAYRENLEIVLQELDELIDFLNGKTIISADHGEAFGEQPYPIIGKLYEHYRHPRAMSLCEVPWLTIPPEDGRREIRKGERTSNNEDADRNIEDHLEALGYR